MNDTWTKLASCDEDVTNIMRWWLTTKSHKKYLRMAMQVGGIREVIQEACLAILKPGARTVACHWTTAAVNTTRWTLLRMVRDHMAKASAEDKFLCDLSHELTMKDTQFEMVVRTELTERLSLCLKNLSWRERTIVELRMQGMMQDEIGHSLNVTKTRISQIERKAMRKLMMPNIAQHLVSFVDR